jgi:hypothetical protein
VTFAAQEECNGGGADKVDDGSGDAQGDVCADVFSESAPPKTSVRFQPYRRRRFKPHLRSPYATSDPETIVDFTMMNGHSRPGRRN